MQALKTGFVLIMLLIVVFPVLFSLSPIQERTPFDVKIAMISTLTDGFVPFPDFPSPPSFNNPVALLSYLSTFIFSFGTYCVRVIVFFTHNITIGTRILRILVMP